PFSPRIFSPAAFHSRTADGARIRRRLYRHFLHRGGAQRLALRHRLALSIGDVAVRMLSRDRSTTDLSAFAYRSPHVSPGSKGENACRKGLRKTASPSGAAKHVQDSAEQLLRLSWLRAGTFRRFRRCSARYADWARS